MIVSASAVVAVTDGADRGLGAELGEAFAVARRGERIWLPFVPWVALVAPGDRRGWLLVQVVIGVVIQTVLRSPW